MKTMKSWFSKVTTFAAFVLATALGFTTLADSGPNFYQDATDVNLWHVSNLAGLKEFRDSVNNGTSYANKTIQIDADIDMSSDGSWEAIKAYPGSYLAGATIDGQSHKITGMSIVTPDPQSGYAYGGGFIDKTAGGLTVKDLAFKNATVTSTSGSQVGIVAGMTYGDVMLDNVDLTDCIVTGKTKTGLLVGQNDDGTVTVKNCDIVNSQAKANYSAAMLIGLLSNVSKGAVFTDNTVDNDSKFVWIASDSRPNRGFAMNGRYFDKANDDTVILITDPGEKCLAEQRTANATITYQGKEYTLWGSIFYPELDFAAQIGDLKYTTLQGAFDAVQEGETINVLADNSETITVTNTCAFTFKSNGFTLGGAPSVPEGYAFTVNGDGTCTYGVAADPLQPEGSTKVVSGFYQNDETYANATEFYITNLNGFHFFRDLINQDNGAIDDYIAKGFYGSTANNFYTENPFKGKTVKLLCEVDEGDVAVKPIGMTAHSRADGMDKRYFYGVFDGCNHTVSNLRVIDDPPTAKHRVGLFGQVTRNADVPMAGVVNLTVSNAVVSGYNYVGGFIGGLNGVVTLTNCHLIGSVTLTGTSSYVGGIVGHNGDGVDSQIVGCSVDVTNGSTLTAKSQGGGIVGYMGGGDILGCTVRGLAISASGSYVLGGIAGKFSATGCVAASNTVDSVTITAKDSGAAGSIVGSFGAVGQTLIDNVVVNTHVYDPGPTEVFGQCHWFKSGDTTTVIGWNSVGTLTAGGITGGTYERLPATYLAEGYEAVAQGTTPETYVVQVAAPKVCKIVETDEQYETLEAAIAAATTDGTTNTIQMLTDVTATTSFVIAATQNVIIDLNGTKITGGTATSTITFDGVAYCPVFINNGTLIMVDNSESGLGKVTNANLGSGNVNAIFVNCGALTVNAGRYGDNDDSESAGNIYGNALVNCTGATAALNGGRYTAYTSTGYLLYNYGALKLGALNDATKCPVLYGTHVRGHINSRAGSTVTIDNVSIIGTKYYYNVYVCADAVVTINGGSIYAEPGTGNGYPYSFCVWGSSASIIVNGGTFSHSGYSKPFTWAVSGDSCYKPVLKGGVYDLNPETDETVEIADSHEVVTNETDPATWTVVKFDPAAKIVTVQEDQMVAVSEKVDTATSDVYIDMWGFYNLQGMLDKNGNECPQYVPTTDEILYRDTAVDEGEDGDWVSAKDIYEGYLAPGQYYYNSQQCYLFKKQDVVTETSYKTLAAAFAAVQNDETIVVLKNNDEVITMPPTATSFTFDSNGYSLTGSVTPAEGYAFGNNGDGTCTYGVAATPVAQIVETGVKYTSFADAVAAVAEGQTIKALCDFTIPASDGGDPGKVVAKVSYTLDGDGHTITCEDASEWDWDADGKVVTFDNVTIVGGRTKDGGTFYFMNSRFTNGTTIDCYQLYTYRNTCYVDATSRLIGRTAEFQLRKGFVVVGADDFDPAVATTAKTNSTAQLYTKQLGMRENGVLALTNANVTAEQEIRSNSVKTKYSDIIATNSLIEIGRSVEYVSEGYKLGIWCPNALPNGRGDMTLAASQRVDLVSCVLRGARNLTNAGLFVAKNTSIEFGNDFTNTGDFTLDGSDMTIGTDFTGPATSGYTGNFVNNGTIFLKNGATLSYVNKAASTGTITVSGSTVTLTNADIQADETMTFDATSKIVFAGTWNNAGSVSFDLVDETGEQYLLVQNDGEATPDVAAYNIALTNADGYELKVVNGSLYAVKSAPAYVAQVGEEKFLTLAAAVEAAKTKGVDTVTLLADCTVDTEVVVGTNKAATVITTIEGTNSVAGGYYTITVKDGGKLVWDYYYTTVKIALKANLVDETTADNGLRIRGRSQYHPTISGSVTAGDIVSGKFDYVEFLGALTTRDIRYSNVFCYDSVTANSITYNGKFYGSVTADSISAGSFYGTVTAPNGSITGGTYYNADAIAAVDAAKADGYTLAKNSTKSWTVGLPDTIVIATLKHGDTVTNYTDPIYAVSDSVSGDVITMVKSAPNAWVNLDKGGLTLVMPNGVSVARIMCTSTCKLVTTVESDKTIYASVALTIDDASAYVVNGATTNFYNSIDNAISKAQTGDSVYLNADRSGNIELKAGVTLYLNGKTVSGAVIMASGSSDHCLIYNEENQCYTSRIRTAEDDDAVATVDYSDGTHYFASLKNAVANIGNGTTATLLKDVSMADSDCYSSDYIVSASLFTGKTIDGDGHTMTYTGSNAPYFIGNNWATIKNIKLAGMRNAVAKQASNGSIFDQVKISGTPANVVNNFGAFVASLNGGPTVTFRNCEMAMNVAAQGARSFYNSAFVGLSNMSATLNFVDCKVTGSVVCGTAGMFIANFYEGRKIVLNVTDTYNEGLIQAIYPATETGDAYAFNPVVAVTWASQLPNLTLNLSQGGVEKTYAGVEQLTSDELFAVLKRNNGKFLNGELDTTLALAKNDQGGFAATTATNADAAKYVISVGLYTGLTLNESSAGSSFFNVTETITTDQHAVKVLPALMNYRFVDAKWFAANPTAVEGTLCGNKTYTLGDETFYYVEEDAGDYLKRTLDGQPTAAECYSISAYDANGTLLHSAVISADEYTLKTSATAPEAAVTYLYDTLESAVQNVEQNGTITILADNDETFTVAPKDGVTAFTIDNTADYELTGTVTPAEGYGFIVNGDGTCSYGAAVARVSMGGVTNEFMSADAAIAAYNDATAAGDYLIEICGGTYTLSGCVIRQSDTKSLTVQPRMTDDEYEVVTLKYGSGSTSVFKIDGVSNYNSLPTVISHFNFDLSAKPKYGIELLSNEGRYASHLTVSYCSFVGESSKAVYGVGAAAGSQPSGITLDHCTAQYLGWFWTGYINETFPDALKFTNCTVRDCRYFIGIDDGAGDVTVDNCDVEVYGGTDYAYAIRLSTGSSGVNSKATITRSSFKVGGATDDQYAIFVAWPKCADTTKAFYVDEYTVQHLGNYAGERFCDVLDRNDSISSAKVEIYRNGIHVRTLTGGNSGYPKSRERFWFETVAQIVSADGVTTNGFQTLQQACDYVKTGDTIEVLEDNDETITITNACAFTFKSNGHTLSATAPIVPEGWKFVREGDVCALGEIVNTGDATTAVVIMDKQTSIVDTNAAAKVISDPAVIEQIEQNTTVTGVKLSPTNEEHAVSGAQSVVTLAKRKGSTAFRTNLEKGTNVIIKVEVAVKPTVYVEPVVAKTDGTIQFNLKPIATVTIDEGGENKTNTVDVTNEMIDQLQDIAVTVYTGFKPAQAVHTDANGNTIQTFYEDQITYDELTGNSTIIIHHFSDVTFYEAEQVARIGAVKYQTLADAMTAVKDGQTIQLLTNVTENVSFDVADTAFTLDFANFSLTGNVAVTAGAIDFANVGEMIGTLSGSITVTQGWYSEDPNAFTATGYGAYQPVAEGLWSVVPNVAVVGDTQYPLLAYAIAAAHAGSVKLVTMIRSTTEAAEIATDVTIFAPTGITDGGITAPDGYVVERTKDATGVTYRAVAVSAGVTVTDCEDVNGSKAAVSIPLEWLIDNDVTEAMASDKSYTAFNGLPIWKSYVLGLNPWEEVAAGNLQVLPQSDGTVDVMFYGATGTVQTDLATVTFKFYADTEVTGAFTTEFTQTNNALFENVDLVESEHVDRRFFKNASIEFTWATK